jgi:hypothetical protein
MGGWIGDPDSVGWREVVENLVDDGAQDEGISDCVCGSKLVAANGVLLRIVWKGGCKRGEDKDGGQQRCAEKSHPKQLNVSCQLNRRVCLSI